MAEPMTWFLCVGQQTSKRQHKDLRYFISAIMFSHLPDEMPVMDSNPRTLTYGEVQPRPVPGGATAQLERCSDGWLSSRTWADLGQPASSLEMVGKGSAKAYATSHFFLGSVI